MFIFFFIFRHPKDFIFLRMLHISWYNNAQLGATLNTFVTGAQGLYVDKDTIKVAFGIMLSTLVIVRINALKK